MKRVSVVMLSNTANNQIYQMTREAIRSLHASEDKFEFEVTLVETNKNYLENGFVYEDAYVLTFDGEFGYNRCLNIGFNNIDPNSEYVVIANNDVVFHKGWFSHIFRAMKYENLDSASPKNPGWFKHTDIGKDVYPGFEVGRHFTGWLIVLKREILSAILPLPEELVFWCSDDMMAYDLQKSGFKHALVGKSEVTHLTSQSHNLIPSGKHHEWTHGQGEILNKLVRENNNNRLDELKAHSEAVKTMLDLPDGLNRISSNARDNGEGPRQQGGST